MNKHHDRLSISRFPCKGYIKITIHENSKLSDVEIQYVVHLI